MRSDKQAASWWFQSKNTYLIFLSFVAITNVFYKHRYSNQKKSSIKKSRVKSPTKANADRHNGEVKRNILNKA